MAIKWDTRELTAGVRRAKGVMDKEIIKPIQEVAFEVLRLSTYEVPHDVGMLQMSGKTEPVSDGVLVGYNKVYAARLHEHPEYNFQKGRKGKYLEDPIKHNLPTFKKFIEEGIRNILK